MSQEQSSWQEKITGEWYGCPSVFDTEGTHIGFNKVNRSSVFKDGITTYYMNTDLDVRGALRSRFEAKGFAFGVQDSGIDRVYMGPDFFGSGNPFGAMVDAHYYSPGWSADLKTMVHILPDGKTQAYSSQLFEGPRLVSVFNGLYLMATDYDSNPATKERIDSFILQEKTRGNTPHILPMKEAGAWTGTFQVYNELQEVIGQNFVKISYQPLDLRRAEVKLQMEGAVNLQAQYVRSREGFRHDFHGPDLYGNAFAYGRALYTSAHVRGQALKIKGREFILDDRNTMSVVWQLYAGDRPKQLMYGVLNWEKTADVLTPQY